MTNTKILFVGCTEFGHETLRYLINQGYKVDSIVTIDRQTAERHDVAGYYPFENIAERNKIDIYYPKKFSMASETDYNYFGRREADAMIVFGWKRLIPSEVLTCFKLGAFGMHGSAYDLPKGRGRSPMNWSLIQNLERFVASLIKYRSGPDSGRVVNSTKFDINKHDDIRTMYYKLVMATQALLRESLDEILANEVELRAQEGEPTYYPKRYPEDGTIVWENPTKQIYNLVRAVADPYPGARTECDGTAICIWNARPFSYDFQFNATTGEIVQVFRPSSDFVVKTADGTVLVTRWEAEDWRPKEGKVLSSADTNGRQLHRIDSKDNKKNLSSGGEQS